VINHVNASGGFKCPCDFFGYAENAHGQNFHYTPYLPMDDSVYLLLLFMGRKAMEIYMDFKNSETIVNLGRAFAGECQARTRYRFYASLAKKEGQPYLARLINEIADNEYAHAKIFFDYINKLSDSPVHNLDIDAGYPYTIGETVMNLKDAANAEKDEYEDIYPKFAEIADNEGFKDVANSFRLIADIEKSHHKSFSILAQKEESGTLYKEEGSAIWRCSVCGYIHEGEKAPQICPVCQHSQGHYELQVNLKQV